jgi:hypothetical protein
MSQFGGGGLYGDPNVNTTFTGDATLVTAASQQADAAINKTAASAEQAAARVEAASARQTAAFQSQVAAARAAAAATNDANNAGALGGLRGLTGSLKTATGAATQFIGVAVGLISRVTLIATAVGGAVKGLYELGKSIDTAADKSRRASEQFAEAQRVLGDIANDKRRAALTDEQRAIEDVQKKYTDLYTTLLSGELNLDTSDEGRRRYDLIKTQLEKAEADEIASIKKIAAEKAAAKRKEQISDEIKADLESAEIRDKNAAAVEADRAGNQREYEARQKRNADHDADVYKRFEDQKKLAREMEIAAQKVADILDEAIGRNIKEIQRLNQQFVAAQNSNLVTAIDRLRETFAALGTFGSFDGIDSGVID